MKPFDLEAFKAGQKALTREGRIATFIGINLQLHKNSQLVTVLDDNDYTTFYYINGNYNKDEEHKLDLVSMVSRHQALIDSYDPEDTWQVHTKQSGAWVTIKQPDWSEDYDWRLHPYNDLIKAWKKGAKIKRLESGGYLVDDHNPTWDEHNVYRIKQEPIIHCLAYDASLDPNPKLWGAPVVSEKQFAIKKGWKIIQEWKV